MAVRFKTQPRLPFESLVEWARDNFVPAAEFEVDHIGDVGRISRLLGVPRTAVYRWQETGVPMFSVDEALIKSGFMIFDIWPESTVPSDPE